MSYQVLSLKWRPQCFDEVVGQIHVTRTLQNSIDMDRVAHGYLFAGPRGVGKTTTARILAKTLSCQNPNGNNPCNACPNCTNITKGSSLDVQELDGASNRGIDEIRELREAVKYPPNNGLYRIYIIDEVHMLTREAFNALLKTLEEPPPHVVFIMATTDVHKIPPTILSRTQKFDFKPISVNEISKYLKQILDHDKISYEEKGILLIAQKADGGLRDALSLLDQVIAYADETLNAETVREVLGIIEERVFLNIIKLIHKKNYKELIAYINQLLNEGFAIPDFINGFNEFIRHCMLSKSGDSETHDISEESKKWLHSECQYSTMDILRILDLSLQYQSNLKNISQPQISMEALFMKLALLDKSIDISQILYGEKNLNDSMEKPQIYTNSSSGIELNEKKEKGSTIEKDVITKKPESKSDKIIEKHPTLSLETIQESWTNTINELEKHNTKIAHFLEDATLTNFDGKTLWIELLNGHRFQQNTLEKDIDQIKDVLNKFLNEQISITFQMKENKNVVQKEKKMENTEHPLFEKVIEEFDGEIIR